MKVLESIQNSSICKQAEKFVATNVGTIRGKCVELMKGEHAQTALATYRKLYNSQVAAQVRGTCAKYLFDNKCKSPNLSTWEVWQTLDIPNYSLLEGLGAVACATPFIAVASCANEITKTCISKKWAFVPMMGCTAVVGRALFEKVDSPMWKMAIIMASFVSGSIICADRFPLGYTKDLLREKTIITITYLGASLSVGAALLKKGVHPIPAMLILGAFMGYNEKDLLVNEKFPLDQHRRGASGGAGPLGAKRALVDRRTALL